MSFSIYEAIMLICFGAAWPFSIIKSWRSRSAKGKSVCFLLIVLVGYIAGILNKTTQGLSHDPVLVLYVVNALMVGIDSALYFRNRRYDRPD
jgi:lipopolysaccharide export LptBFGC system permease protein LptF